MLSTYLVLTHSLSRPSSTLRWYHLNDAIPLLPGCRYMASTQNPSSSGDTVRHIYSVTELRLVVLACGTADKRVDGAREEGGREIGDRRAWGMCACLMSPPSAVLPFIDDALAGRRYIVFSQNPPLIHAPGSSPVQTLCCAALSTSPGVLSVNTTAREGHTGLG